MELGAMIPHFGPFASPTFVPTFCRRAEEAGFDGLWAVEHLAVPRTMSSEYTLARRPIVVRTEAIRATMGLNLEMLTTLAVAAAVTTRVRLGTSVAVLPLRNPILNARQLASIDLYSGGRLVYGVGVGWLKEEADALGMPWDRRGARTDEHIEILRTLWGAEGDDASFEGAFHSFPAIDPDPRPGRKIPILVGGHSAAAFERAARVGDGWIAAAMSPDRVASSMAQLAAACERHGRDLAELWLVCAAGVELGAAGDDGAVVEGLARYAELGIHHAVVRVGGASESELLDALGRWGEVLPSLR
ncbi:MAG: TIGR03619 family F420-dependent LLM class oxidoreductase [Acidimicrobiales bacterium]